MRMAARAGVLVEECVFRRSRSSSVACVASHSGLHSVADDELRSSATQSSIAATRTVERAVLLATLADMPAASVGETADMAGLATCSTAGESSQAEKILRYCRACPSFPAIRGRQVTPLQGPRT